MAKVKTQPTPQKPVSAARQKQLDIAAINEQVVAAKITPEEGQRQIDALNGIVRQVDEETGNVTMMAANLENENPE